MWCLLALVSLLATSCYSLDANVVVNDDGSGSFAVEYIIEKDTTEASLIAGDLVAACDAVKVMQNAAPAGSIFTPLESSSQCGARIEMEFANETEMVDGLRTVSDRSRFAGFGYFPDITVSRGDVDGAWNFQSQFKPPLPANLDAQTEFRNEVAGGSFIFTVNLPGRQVEHNADRIDENGAMIFEVNPLVDPSGQMFVQTEPGPKILGVAESSSFPWTTVLFGLVALAAIGAAVLILNRSKRRRQYEGEDDDDDSMVSASERLGLGSPAPVADASLGETEASPSANALFSDGATPEVAVDSAEVEMPGLETAGFETAGFDGVGMATESWPSATRQDAPSPVFDAPVEVADAPSWVSASQAIEGEPVVAEVQEFVAPQPEIVASAAPAVDGWPSEPVVASAAAVSPATSTVVDHSTDSISSVPGNAAGFEPAGSTGWPSVEAVVPVEPFTAQEASIAHVPFSDPVSAPPEAAWPEVQAPAAVAEPVPGNTAESVVDAPTQSDMVWDQQRNAYVVYDHRRSSWMMFDDASQAWTAIS